MRKTIALFTILTMLTSIFPVESIASVRIKDIAQFQGVRDNQLIGYGLVVGLNGTGDKSQSAFTIKSIASLLNRLGVKISESSVKPSNVAAVMITATLPPFIKSGARIDVTLSSLGDAKSLEGGTLLLTPLQGADGKVYAVAQGNVILGAGEGGETFSTVGRIPAGALIEKALPVTLVKDGQIYLSITNVDFTTCVRMSEAINVDFGENIAKAEDGATVAIKVPDTFKDNLMPFLARIETITVNPDRRAKIIINERTGTIVGGEDAKISKVSISHKNINVEIEPQDKEIEGVKKEVKKAPKRLALDEAMFLENAIEEKTNIEQIYTTVGEVGQLLNSMGVKPPDMISIFQAIKETGAIQADIEII